MGAVLPSLTLSNRAVGLPSLRLPGGPLVRPRYLLRHTFSGASVTPSDLGPSLTTVSGPAVVSGGVLATSGGSDCQLGLTTLAVNVAMQVKVNFGGGAGTNRRVFLRARDDNAGATRYEAILYRSGTTGLEINRRTGGGPVPLGFSAISIVDSTPYWFRFVAVGNRLEALFSTDGSTFVSKLVVTDATYPNVAGVQLLLQDNAVSPTLTADDFLIWRPS
jgi:hypothetical protein